MARRALLPFLPLMVILSGPGAARAEEAGGDGLASFEEDFFTAPPPPASVTIHLDDVELQAFLDGLGAQIDQRWAVAEGVDARVTVHADDEPWTQVLHRTLAPLGLTEAHEAVTDPVPVRFMTVEEHRRAELNSGAFRRRMELREARIVGALEDLARAGSSHPWAGSYRSTSGFEWARLDIAPDGEFLYLHGGCTGLARAAYGTVEALGVSRLRVIPERDLGLEWTPALTDLVVRELPGCVELVRETDMPELGARLEAGERVAKDPCEVLLTERILIRRDGDAAGSR